MWMMSPSAPLSTSVFSSRIEAKQRLLLPLPSTTPASRQAATARAASARVSASGFSHHTGLPAWATARDLLDMQRMRRRQEHRLHVGIGDGLVEFGGEPEAVLRGEAAHVVRLLADAVDEAELLALALHGGDQGLAPASEADDGGIDHGKRGPRTFGVANVWHSR